MTTILFAARSERWDAYEAPLRAALSEAGMDDATLATDADPANGSNYMTTARKRAHRIIHPYTQRLKAAA